MAAETATILGTEVGKDGIRGQDINRVQCHVLEAPNTADAADTITFDLASVGGSTFLGLQGCKHTTDDSVVVRENPTTSVSGTTLTLTIPAGTDNDKRIVKIYFT